MHTPVVTVPPGHTVRQAAELMRDRQVGSVVVVDDDQAPVGILTERDLTHRIVAAGRSPEDTAVKDVMSSPVITIQPSVHLDDALEAMREHGIKRLVVTLEGKLRGVVTVTDLAHAQPELSRRLRGALSSRWED